MKLRRGAIEGLVIAEIAARTDERGAFARLFCEEELADLLGGRRIVQINHSVTRRVGAVRGLHFQHPPKAEMKFVRCLRGRVWDVAADLRGNSPTFRKHSAVELSGDNGRMVVIPEGCAHGFQVLEPDTELLYLHTAMYAPEHEGGVLWNDPLVAIAWPLPLSEISPRDRNLAELSNDYAGIRI